MSTDSTTRANWSGKRGSNSRPRPWQGRALPTELFPQGIHVKIWSGKRGSNSRPRPWQGRALPTELFPHTLLVRCILREFEILSIEDLKKKIQMLKKSSFRLKLQQNLTQEYNFSLVFNFYFYHDWVCDKIGAFCSPLNQEKCGQIFACFRGKL